MIAQATGGASIARGVRPATVLQASLLISVVANLGRIPLFSTGESNAPLLVNDLAVAAVLVCGLLVSLRNRMLRIDAVGLAGLAFAVIGGASALAAAPRFGFSTFE